MTNTERHGAVELDELPPWDDAETLDRLAAQLTAADTRSHLWARQRSPNAGRDRSHRACAPFARSRGKAGSGEAGEPAHAAVRASRAVHRGRG
jgi:hypothetical protein